MLRLVHCCFWVPYVSVSISADLVHGIGHFSCFSLLQFSHNTKPKFALHPLEDEKVTLAQRPKYLYVLIEKKKVSDPDSEETVPTWLKSPFQLASQNRRNQSREILQTSPPALSHPAVLNSSSWKAGSRLLGLRAASAYSVTSFGLSRGWG